MSYPRDWPPIIWYSLIILICFGVSFGDVVYASWHNPGNGSIGGAVATVVALFASVVPEVLSKGLDLVLTDHGEPETTTASISDAREDDINTIQSPDSICLLEVRKTNLALCQIQSELNMLQVSLSALRIRVDERDTEAHRQSIALAIGGLIGAVFWAFGNTFATALQHLHE